jgi:DNA mismatch repair ATPase MutL
MDSKQTVMATLEATAKQKSIDDLKAKGKTKVKVIRAKDIANLIQQAVERALQDSDMLPQGQVDELVEKSKAEFRDLQRKWQQHEQTDHDKDHEIQVLKSQLAEAQQSLSVALAAAQSAPAAAAPAAAPAAADPAQAAPAGIDPNTMMLKMMEQLMDLKTQAAAPVQAPQGGGSSEDALASKLDAIVGSLDKKLESFGKKMGVSAASDTGEVDLGNLFDSSLDVEMESNMDTVELEKRESGGIAANLARIKKMKDGG